MAKSKACKYADTRRECEFAAEKDEGLCSEHASDWMRSTEFTEAMKDTKVIGWMRLGMIKKAMAVVNRRHKSRWLKRMRTPAGESSPE